jgi:hypothetical protein
MQQTALQRALQPASRLINREAEHFDISDTEENLQQPADDSEASFEDFENKRRKRGKRLQSILEVELADPMQIGDMMSSSSASSVRPIIQSYDEQAIRNFRWRSNPKGGHRGTSSSSASAASEQSLEIPCEEVRQITQGINIDA